MKDQFRSRLFSTGCAAFLGLALLAGCTYDEPITAKPTRKIEPRLLGEWKAASEEKGVMKVCKLDDSNYVLTYDGELYRAFHSDFAGLPLVSVQELDGNRKYAYLTWKLSDDGKVLTLRVTDTKVITEDLKTTAAVQKALKANASNPGLFDEENKYNRQGE
jgi:hypothetical protein